MPGTTACARSTPISGPTTGACASASAIRGTRTRCRATCCATFPKADQDWLDDLLRGVSDGAPALAAGDAARFMNAVSLRVAPPRSGGGVKPPAPTPAAAEPEPEIRDERSALRRLADRFR